MTRSTGVLGPFPQPRPDLRRPGWIEHIVYGPVKAVVYTTLRFDDHAVQEALAAFFATAADRDDVEAYALTPRSALAAVQLADAAKRARAVRDRDGGCHPGAADGPDHDLAPRAPPPIRPR